MKVKIFTGFGLDGTTRLENEVNTWLHKNRMHISVINTQSALCQVTESAAGERYQSVVITVWYNEIED